MDDHAEPLPEPAARRRLAGGVELGGGLRPPSNASPQDRLRGQSPRSRVAMKRLGVLIAGLVAMALAGPAGAQDTPRFGGELIFAVPSEMPSYDAHRESTFGIVHPMAPHHSTLLRVDPMDRSGSKVVGDLAESWTVARDGRTYTFRLRRGVKFHDGAEFTSRDAKATYDKIAFPPLGVASERKGAYVNVEAIEAPDPYTLVFRLKWPQGSFLSSLASPWNWIYKADILAKDMRWYETHVMGTGPFVFVEHVKGSHWVGKRNPNYWDKGKPYLGGYRALFIKDSAAQVAAIRGERAHIQFRGFSPAERDSLVAALGPKIAVQESPWDCGLLVTMNHEKKPFDDKRVRRALTLALDRYQGSQALSKIPIVQEVAESAKWFADLRGGDFEVAMDAQCGYMVEPDLDLYKFQSGPTSADPRGISDANYTRYKDSVLDELYVKQGRAIDLEERKKYVREFEKRLLDAEVHTMYTLQWHRIIPHNSRVKGWTVTPSHYLNNQLDTVWLAE